MGLADYPRLGYFSKTRRDCAVGVWRRALDSETELSQCALAQKGLVKVQNFRASDNKRRYAYVLPPRGAEAKIRLTVRFLKRKLTENERSQTEIAALESDMWVGCD